MNRAAVKTKKKSAQSKRDAANNAKNKQSAASPAIPTTTTTTTPVPPTTKSSTTQAGKHSRRSSLDTNTASSKTAAAATAAAATEAVRKNSVPIINATTIVLVEDDVLPPIRKMERAHTSFSLTRKLSKIYGKLTTGSKENLAKIAESESANSSTGNLPNGAGADTPDGDVLPSPALPFKFTRSLSMASIPLRQSFRRVFRDHNKLEKLHEENSNEKVDAAAGASSVDTIDGEAVLVRPGKAAGLRLHSRMSEPVVPTSDFEPSFASTPTPDSAAPVMRKRSLTGSSGTAAGSSSVRRTSFRRTIRDLLSKPSSCADRDLANSKWSASLASLQQIDNMVSYEDLSFIDYDKFNSVEQTLAAQRRARQRSSTLSQDVPLAAVAAAAQQVVRRKSAAVMAASATATTQAKPESLEATKGSLPHDGETNFDQPKNLYRWSLDDRKLRFLSHVNRESFRLSDYYETDRPADEVLNLDEVRQPIGTGTVDGVGGTAAGGDGEVTSAAPPHQLQSNRVIGTQSRSLCDVRGQFAASLLSLKSKSLNHLDNLESDIGTQTECPLSPKPVDYLEVEPTKIGCLSTSPTTSLNMAVGPTLSLRKRIPSFRSQKKKPILSRSEVSSSEYFCVYYDVESCSKDREDMVPAAKGTTLAEALHSGLLQRNLSFSQITISDNNFPSSIDLGSPPYAGGVNQHTDVGNLAGKFLIVTEKEKPKRSGHALQKAASFGARQRPAKLFQSASTEDPNASGGGAGGSAGDADASSTGGGRLSASQLFPKHAKQRWSGLFGLRNPQQNQLCELLNSYTRTGVPQSTPVAFNFEHEDLAAAMELLDALPATWKDFVCTTADAASGVAPLTDAQYQMQMAIWELVTTEAAYIHALQVVTDLFLACLEAIQSEHILTDVDQHKLFSNIREICETNIRLWTLFLYPMVQHSRATGAPMCIDWAQPAFMAFDQLFAPYEKYCAEQSTCQFYCKELHSTNTLFQAYLAWCEGQKLCNRLRLSDILVHPMQRLTKYGLLLLAIKKHIAAGDETALLNMKAMTSSVDDFVVSVNSHLTDRQKNERIKGIMARIESYDVVDNHNDTLDKMVKEYSQPIFDLCAPMRGCSPTDSRNLFMEGDLRFKDNIGKMDVHCFLLTDMLLVCKTIAKNRLGTLKVVRQPFFTDRLVNRVKENTLYAVYLNELNMPVTAFTLQCPEAQNWHEAINKTKLVFADLRQHGLAAAAAAAAWDVDAYSVKYDLSGCSETMAPAGTAACSIGGGSSDGRSGGGVGGMVRTKSPLNSSIGSRISSLNNSHSFSCSGSVELTESNRAVSVDYEKANSLSSDEGAAGGGLFGKKAPQNSPAKLKGLLMSSTAAAAMAAAAAAATSTAAATSNTLLVQPSMSLGQSLPNLNLNSPHQSHNTLLVPGHAGHSNTALLSPSHRGISYPPPSPTRVLRRGFAFSSSIKNPPLVKSRNVISQNSFAGTSSAAAAAAAAQHHQHQHHHQQQQQHSTSSSSSPSASATASAPLIHQQQMSRSRSTSPANLQHQQHQPQRAAASTHHQHADIEHQIQNSNESDV